MGKLPIKRQNCNKQECRTCFLGINTKNHIATLYNINNFKNKRKVFVDKLNYTEYYIIVVEASATKTFFLMRERAKAYERYITFCTEWVSARFLVHRFFEAAMRMKFSDRVSGKRAESGTAEI